MFVAPVVMERDDMGMLEPGHCSGFGLEAGHEIGVAGEFGKDDFEGNLPVDRRLSGAVDCAEPPGANGSDYLITAFLQIVGLV
jgi:hypothetical protein